MVDVWVQVPYPLLLRRIVAHHLGAHRRPCQLPSNPMMPGRFSFLKPFIRISLMPHSVACVWRTVRRPSRTGPVCCQ